MVKKYLPRLIDLDHKISLMPKNDNRLQAKQALGALLTVFLKLQQSKNLKGAKARAIRYKALIKT